MKNKSISELCSSFMNLRCYVLDCIQKVYGDGIQSELKFHNSAIYIILPNYDLTIRQYWDIKVTKIDCRLDASDFDRIDKLNSLILNYNTK